MIRDLFRHSGVRNFKAGLIPGYKQSWHCLGRRSDPASFHHFKLLVLFIKLEIYFGASTCSLVPRLTWVIRIRSHSRTLSTPSWHLLMTPNGIQSARLAFSDAIKTLRHFLDRISGQSGNPADPHSVCIMVVGFGHCYPIYSRVSRGF